MFFTSFSLHRDSQFPAIAPQEWSSLQGIVNQLTENHTRVEQWFALKDLIQQYIRNSQFNISDLERFLRQIISYGVEQDANGTLAFVADIIDLQALEEMIRNKSTMSSRQQLFNNTLEWARGEQPFYPHPLQSPPKHSPHIFWRHWGPLVVYFMPNLINIFLESFDFLDTQRKYTTLWDKYLLLEIIYKFYIIPSALIKILKPFIGTSIKTYFVAGFILASLAACLACYKLYLKPLPPEIVNCKNLNRSLSLHQRSPIYGQAAFMRKLIGALHAGSHVLLVGASGEGKTALIEHLCQLQLRGQLPQSLNDKVVYTFDCSMFNSNGPQGYRALMDQTYAQIDGNSHRTIFFLDGFCQIIANEVAFRAVKDRVKEEPTSCNFIAAVTFEDYDRLNEYDKDNSLKRGMTTIVIDSADNEDELRLILTGLIDRLAPDLPLGEGAFEAIIASSKEGRFLNNIGRPGRIEKILKEAAERCRYAYQPEYVPTELNQKYQRRESLQRQYQWQLLSENWHADSDQLSVLNGEISILESTLLTHKRRIEKIHSLYKDAVSMKNFYVKTTHDLANQQSALEEEGGAPSELVQKRYLLSSFFLLESLKEKLKAEIAEIPKGIPIQITVELIQEVCNDLSQQEGLFNEPSQSRASSSMS